MQRTLSKNRILIIVVGGCLFHAYFTGAEAPEILRRREIRIRQIGNRRGVGGDTATYAESCMANIKVSFVTTEDSVHNYSIDNLRRK